MQKAVELIRSNNEILILAHKNPDGDAVGSVLALDIALAGLKKRSAGFFSDSVPKVFEYLPDVSRIKNNDSIEPKKYDLIILLDCDDLGRTGIKDFNKVFSGYDNLLIIDHHPVSGEKECKDNCHKVVDPSASSTAIMIYKFLKEMKVEITKDIANCILTGIFADTGSFQHSNTDEDTLKAAAELMKKGARTEKIARQIFQNRTIPAIKLWGKALSRIETDKTTGMAVSYLSKDDLEEYDVNQEELSGLVSTINTISDARFSMFLTEYGENKLKGSLRSEEYKGIDVSRIAKSLGGGGHKLASGFEMEGEIKESIQKITKMIMDTKKDSVINK